MGLDMYLIKKPKYSDDDKLNKVISRFVAWIKDGDDYTFQQWCGLNTIKELPDLRTLIDIIGKASPVHKDEKEVFYWRKANAIHRWFVENVQDGIDDCATHRAVTKEDIQKLKGLCDAVLSDHKLADQLLPAMPGFFFGQYEYDDDYFYKIERTSEACERIIEEFDFDKYYLYYNSSW